MCGSDTATIRGWGISTSRCRAWRGLSPGLRCGSRSPLVQSALSLRTPTTRRRARRTVVAPVSTNVRTPDPAGRPELRLTALLVGVVLAVSVLWLAGEQHRKNCIAEARG